MSLGSWPGTISGRVKGKISAITLRSTMHADLELVARRWLEPLKLVNFALIGFQHLSAQLSSGIKHVRAC